MTKHHLTPWITCCLLLLSMTIFSCAELSPPSAEGLPCGSSTECAGLICNPDTMTCEKPTADLDAGSSDTDHQNPIDADKNPQTDTNNPVDKDTDENPPTSAFSGCKDDTQCAGYQTCNIARGRCEDARKSCVKTDSCNPGEHCNNDVCTNQCNDSNDCAQGLECHDTGSQKLCVTLCKDFSANSADCAPDTHCIPLFGSNGGVCKGTGRKKHDENCLPNGDPDSCQSGHACMNLGQQRTCQKLCAETDDAPACSAETYCEPFFYGPDTTSLIDDAGVCLNDCNTNGLPDNNNCPPEHTCLASPDTGKSFCVADDGGGLDAPCDFTATSNAGTGCAIGLGCLAAGHATTTGNPEVGVCTSLCNPTLDPTGCADGYSCLQRGEQHTAHEGVCIKTCDPHKSAATNGCPVGRERCTPETENAVPRAPGLCVASGNILPGETCSTDSLMSCTGDNICAILSAMQGQKENETEGVCTTFCPAFDYTNPTRCPDNQVCGAMFFEEQLGFCTPIRTTQGTKSADRCDDTQDNLGKWCADNLLCNNWNAQFLTCEVPCFIGLPNTCPAGTSCGHSLVHPDSTFGYCR